MRVLVVEDEPEVAEFLSRVLRDATWATDVVGTVAAAREQMAVVTYDLAVIDVGLPDADGFDLLRRILRLGQLRRSQLLLVVQPNGRQNMRRDECQRVTL